MYRYIGEAYSLEEFKIGSKLYFRFNEYLDFINEYKLDNNFSKISCKSLEDREVIFNEFTDILSCLLIEPKNIELILLKMKNLSLRYVESYFLLSSILDIATKIRQEKFSIFLPKPNEFDCIKIQKCLLEIKNENLFTNCYNIDLDSNDKLLLGFRSVISDDNNAIEITSFFEKYLAQLRDVLFQPFRRFSNESNNQMNAFSFDIVGGTKEIKQDLKLETIDKVILFNKLMLLSNFDELTQRKKAFILSLLFSESEETTRNHLRMYDNNISNINDKFKKSIDKIDQILSRFKIT